MTDANSPLLDMFPIDFQYNKMDKLFEWMHEPILPHINVENVLHYIN